MTTSNLFPALTDEIVDQNERIKNPFTNLTIEDKVPQLKEGEFRTVLLFNGETMFLLSECQCHCSIIMNAVCKNIRESNDVSSLVRASLLCFSIV